MKSFHLIKTKQNNCYLYSYKNNSLIYCKPPLYELIKKFQNQKKTDNCILNNIETMQYSIEEIEYQLKKYTYLNAHGYFTSISYPKLNANITKESIKNQLANLRQLTFEVTDSCNLKCEYCGYGKFYNDFDQRVGKLLDFEIVKKILDFMFDLWQSEVNISNKKTTYISFYGGEPLLNMSLIKKVVEYINEKNKTQNVFVFSLTTNAILLDKYIDYFVENNFWLLISLDGNKRNNSYRILKNGKESFNCVIKNIEYTKQRYPKYFEKYVNFNSVLHNRNSIDEIHEFILKKYNKKPTISELNPSGIEENLRKEFNDIYQNVTESLNSSENYEKITKDLFINLPNISNIGLFLNNYTNFCYRNYLDFYSNNRYASFCPTGSCFPFSKKLYLTVNGKILPCERIGHQYNLGRVDDKMVSLDFEKIAKKYNQLYDKMRRLCSKCYFSMICTQCMFYLNIDEISPKCSGFTTKSEFDNYLSNLISMLENKPDYYLDLMTKITIE